MYLIKTCSRRFNTGVSLKCHEVSGDKNSEYIELQMKMIYQFAEHLSNEKRVIDYIFMYSDKMVIQVNEEGITEETVWEIDNELSF